MSNVPARRPFAQLNKNSVQDQLRIKTVEANRRYRSFLNSQANVFRQAMALYRAHVQNRSRQQ